MIFRNVLNQSLIASAVSLALFSGMGFAKDNDLDKKVAGVSAQKTSSEQKYEFPKLAGAELQPEEKFRDTGQLVAWLLMQSHYEHPDFDNQLSEESFKQLIKMLDPNRSYFLASDVKKFKVFEKQFDDAIRTGRIDLAYDFFELYEKRHRERYEYSLSLLNKPFDFSKEEDFSFDRRESPWFQTKEQLNAYWRKKVKYDALSLKLADQKDSEIKEKLSKRYTSTVRRMSQTNSEDVFGFFMNAINASIDPHTKYYTPRQFEDFTINMSLKLQGIGAVLTQEDEFTKVVKLVNKGPAFKTGQLHKDDKIVGVGQGDKGEIVDVIGWRNTDVVDLIRGEAGSVVRLEVIPHTSAGGETKVVRIVREEIKLEDQAAKSDVIEIDNEGKKSKLGIIELPSFYAESTVSSGKKNDLTSTTTDVKKHIKKLKEENIDGLIIDLRNNGGGSLAESVKMTGLFIDKGPVVQGKDYDGNVRVLKDKDGKTFYSGPLVVLVNGSSASASEIFAGAIQDYGRGLVLGENTFGKGTVQGVRELSRFMRNPEGNMGALKLTVEKFYRVTGESTQLMGVKPDISFPSFYDIKDHGETSYDNALNWDTIESSKFDRHSSIGKFVTYLTNKHKARATSVKEFSNFIEDVERIKTERAKKSVSLHYETRLAKRKENEEKRLARANAKRKLKGEKAFLNIKDLDEHYKNRERELMDFKGINYEDDFILKESANILADFIEVKKNPDIANNIPEIKNPIN